MAYRLKMVEIQAIYALLERGWSHRRIARELGVHRGTVDRYAKEPREADSKAAKVTAGSDPKPAKVTAGSRSQCEPHQRMILEALEAGLSAQRIYQDLKSETDYAGSYESVKRYVRRLRATTPLPFRRMETGPGQEVQVDFGKGAFVERKGKRRRPHLFRMVLSFSRKAYSEVVWSQNTETFIRCFENGFRYFGGIPETAVIDNLKSGVIRPDWFDPDLNPKFESFSRHYGFAVLPTKPRMPRHKGKVESGVKYVQENALRGRVFRDLAEQNRFLKDWEANVADKRIHGTTRKQVQKLFADQERGILKALPTTSFPCFEEGERKVHRDGHIALENAYYSTPPEFVGHHVWVRWDDRLVRIYSKSFRQVAIHSRVEPGRFQTHAHHLDPRKTTVIEKGADYLLRKAALVGENSAKWAQALLARRGVEALRTLQGFLSMTDKYSAQKLERATAIALSHEVYRLKSIRKILAEPSAKEQISFLEEHPVIRNMSDYEAFIQQSISRKEAT